MSIGSGIFLSAILFAIVYLAKSVKFSWKKILKAILIVVLALVAISVVIFAYVKISNVPTKQTKYAELKLGMTMQEVEYVKGAPSSVLAEPEAEGEWKGFSRILAVKNFKNGESPQNYYSWAYDEPLGNRIDVMFSKKEKRVQSISCYSMGYSNCPSLFGIYDGESENIVIDKLGKPDRTRMEGLTKEIAYTGINVYFYLQKQNVYTLGVTTISDSSFNEESKTKLQVYTDEKVPPGTSFNRSQVPDWAKDNEPGKNSSNSEQSEPVSPNKADNNIKPSTPLLSCVKVVEVRRPYSLAMPDDVSLTISNSCAAIVSTIVIGWLNDTNATHICPTNPQDYAGLKTFSVRIAPMDSAVLEGELSTSAKHFCILEVH